MNESPMIARYELRVFTNDAHTYRVHDVSPTTLATAKKIAKKIADAYKVEIMGIKHDGALYHSMPVNIVFNRSGGDWHRAVTTYHRN